MKILIAQSAFIGDVVLTVPLIEEIRQSMPSVEIHFLTLPAYSDFMGSHPAVSRVIDYDKSGADKNILNLIKFCSSLKKEKYDIGFAVHRSFRTGLVLKTSGIKRIFGFHNAAGRIFYTDKVKYNSEEHEVDRALLLGKTAGFGKWDGQWNLPWGKSDAPASGTSGRFVITVNPFSNWETKRWPSSGWVKLINSLSQDIDVNVIGSIKDVTAWNTIRRGLRKKVTDLVGRTDFMELAAVIRRSDLLITGDSAPLHFASAFGIKSVVIFGPTVPEFGFGPYGQKNIILQYDLACRPCDIHGPRKCPRGDHECMKAISPGEVLEAVVKLLGLSD